MVKYFRPVLGILFFAVAAFSQVVNENAGCAQSREEREALIDEATRTEFNTRRVEIVGSTYTRYREFAKRMAGGLHEGDIFSRVAIEESVRRMSRMKVIYPITMDNVKIRLNRTYQDVDIVICVRQKPQR